MKKAYNLEIYAIDSIWNGESWDWNDRSELVNTTIEMTGKEKEKFFQLLEFDPCRLLRLLDGERISNVWQMNYLFGAWGNSGNLISSWIDDETWELCDKTQNQRPIFSISYQSAE